MSDGDKDAFAAQVPLVYDQLRRLASNCLRSEREDHTLQNTALVHDVYIRLADAGGDWKDRVHFYAVAARVMRHILVDVRDHSKVNKSEQAPRFWSYLSSSRGLPRLF